MSPKERMNDMKKFLSVLLAGLVLCMSLSAFALTPEDFEAAANAQVTSGNVKMTVKAEVTELDKDVLKNLTGMDFTALPSMEIGYDMVLIMDESLKKMQAKVDMTLKTVPAIPLMSQEFGTAWIDFDITNAESPKYRAIVKTPESEKYQVIDYMKLPGGEAMVAQIAKMMEEMTPEKIVEWNEKLNTYLPEIEKEYKDNAEIITLNDAQVKELIGSVLTGMKEVMLPMVNAMVGTSDITVPGVVAVSPIDLQEQMEQSITAVLTALKDVKLFADDGIVVTTTLDKDTKQLQSMDCVVKIDTNLNELVSKVGKAVGMTDADVTDVLKDLPVDKANFKGQLSMSMAFSNLNDETLKVEFPVLTDENSENLTELMMLDVNAVNVYYNGKKVDFKDVQPVIENDRTLVPIRHFCNALGIGDDDIQYDEGVVTIQNGDTKMTLKIDAQDVVIEQDGEIKNVTLDVPATEREGRTLVPLRFISENFGCDVSYEEFTDEVGNVTGSVITIVPVDYHSAG